MKSILIISPCFPPINTPDMHRVRLSIPWFINKGLRVKVLAVQPKYIEANVDPILEKIPDPCEVVRVKAFSTKLTRFFGLGNLGYRSWIQLKREGNRILEKEKFDIVYFSTTVFPSMTLGRLWQKKFGIPFVVDMQDPWRNDFYLSQPKHNKPPKYKIAHLFDTILEKWTIPYASGIISVSDKYPQTLNERYNKSIPSKTITFTASKNDFKIVNDLNIKNRIFEKNSDVLTFVYTGAVTPAMPIPLNILLKSIKNYLDHPHPKKIRVFFIGTSYAENKKSNYRIMDLIKALNLEQIVYEYPNRIGYFDSIKILMDADALLLPGSTEAGYTASKIYPYILSEKPIFAITNSKSSVSEILNNCNVGKIITFDSIASLESMQNEINQDFLKFTNSLPYKTSANWDYYKKFSDETMSNAQLEFFKGIIEN